MFKESNIVILYMKCTIVNVDEDMHAWTGRLNL
jgi:hypothetical protein